jgi:hypothetical protein
LTLFHICSQDFPIVRENGGRKTVRGFGASSKATVSKPAGSKLSGSRPSQLTTSRLTIDIVGAVMFAILASSAGAWFAPAHAEEGCPAGQLPSSIGDSTCDKVSESSELPLDPSKPMAFEGLQDSLTILYVQATGTITPDTPARFAEFLKSDDAKLTKNLQLHSPGGDVAAGLKLGEMIRKAGYNTSIARAMRMNEPFSNYQYEDAMCVGACAYAFLGGVTRSFTEKETYGLPLPDSSTGSAAIATYLERMGLGRTALDVASRQSTGEPLYRVPVAVAEQVKIIFDLSGQAEFRMGAINGDPVARFEFTKLEKKYRGMIRCVDHAITLYIVDRGKTIPADLHAIRDAPAEFEDGTKTTLHATASFVEEKDSYLMIFKIPALTALSFSGNGLMLSDIYNLAIEQRQSDNPNDKDALLDKMNWLNSVTAFAFEIRAQNGEALAPILDACRNP